MVKIITNIFTDEEKRKVVDEQALYEVSQSGLDYMKKYEEFFAVLDFKKYSIKIYQEMR